MATIYSRLLELGYTDEQIRGDEDWVNANPRGFRVLVMDQGEDADPLVGVMYTCDFRAEEEWGIADLARAISGAKKDKVAGYRMGNTYDHFAKFVDLPLGAKAFMISTRPIATEKIEWGDDIFSTGFSSWPRVRGSRHLPEDASVNYSENYDTWWARAVQYVQDKDIRYRETVPQLRARAKALGLAQPYPTRKADLKALVEDNLPAKHPDFWPGWFHFGTEFILRADGGLAADVLSMLWEAIEDGALGIGGGFGAFNSGIGLYDVEDLTKAEEKLRNKMIKTQKAAAKAKAKEKARAAHR